MDTSLWTAFWISIIGCGGFIFDAVVLWHHRPKLALAIFPMAVVLMTTVSLLEISRSWVGLLSWLLAVATIGIAIASIEYVGFKKRNHL